MHERADSEDVLPLLARLARAAAPESEAWIYAHRHLAELAVEHDPWRAALFARRVIVHRPDDDGAWAVLGLAQSLLGNCRFAAHAYREALKLAPDNPWYAHNLGHLYDVALDRAADALPLLARATLAQPDEADIAASYAHALARCGKLRMARRVLGRAIRRGGTADQMALSRWLDSLSPTPEDAGALRRITATRTHARKPPAVSPARCAPGSGPRAGACAAQGAALLAEPASASCACDEQPAKPRRTRRRRARDAREPAEARKPPRSLG